MKKCIVLLLCLVCVLTACSPRGVQPFSVEAGQAVWQQVAEPAVAARVAQRIPLPEGYAMVADWGDWGLMIARVVSSDGTELYGVWRDGREVLPCRYTRLAVDGAYALGQFYDEEGMWWEVYNRDGACVVGTTMDNARLRTVSDRYFVLYTDEGAQMFDEGGNACFADGVLAADEGMAVCGDYLLSYSTTKHAACVWQLYTSARGSTAFLRRRFEGDGRYTAVYMGGRFLVTRLSTGTATDYTYLDVVNGQSYYVRQEAWWYDAEQDRLTPTRLDYVLLATRSAYTPGITSAEVQALHLREGYTVVTVAALNDYGLHQSERYYVVDASATRMARYAEGVTPTSIWYRGDRGFVGSSLADGVAAMYDWQGNLLWQDKRHNYATMQWQWGRFVASYMQDGVAVYGAFDADGRVAVPFAYQYLSPYVEGYAVARLDGGYYRVDAEGVLLAEVAPACPDYWMGYGVYAFREGDKVGLCNLRGDVLEPAAWQQAVAVGTGANGRTYVVMASDGCQTVLILAE